jgi:serine phosphatase RsbU (regulator of sigma subunit)
MLPQQSHSRRLKWALVLVLALSPLAYLASIAIIQRHEPGMQAGLSVNRDEAIKLAAQSSAANGVSVEGWEAFSVVAYDNQRLYYYRMLPGSDLSLSKRLAPVASIDVLFRSVEQSQVVRVKLAPDGRALSWVWRRTKPEGAPAVLKDAGEETARRKAEEVAQSEPELRAFTSLPPPTVKEDVVQGAITRRYSWLLPLPASPMLKLQLRVAITGDQLVEKSFEAQLDPVFARNNFSSGNHVSIVIKILYGLAVAVVLAFGLYRFAQRAQQKEVSYQRMLVLALAVTALFLAVILQSDIATFEFASEPNNPKSVWWVFVPAGMTYLFFGLLLGLAYGSGEGDIREAYPGKLTSLDALITGRIFSRNVARAVVIGTLIGGWVLLSRSLMLLWSTRSPTGGPEGEGANLSLMSGRAGWLSPFLGWTTDVLLVIVVALLLPLPFLMRRLRSPKLIRVLLAMFAWVACMAPFHHFFRPWTALVVLGAFKAAVLLAAFFYFDVLTAMAGLAAPLFVMTTLGLAAQPSATLRRDAWVATAVALVFIAIETFQAFRGRLYTDDEVSPVYARNLAERLSLQAEASAAREAQVRLLPARLPATQEVSCAARCLPAHEVGGDFYDIFELDENRIGVFVVEGGGRGLASALSIAYAKGFLTPKLFNDSGHDTSPSEVVRSLETRLAEMLDVADGMGITYATLDVSDGVLRYARAGQAPRVFVGRGHEAGLVVAEEREVMFGKVPHRENVDVAVKEGILPLKPGDQIVMLTDGIVRSLANDSQTGEVSFWHLLSERQAGRQRAGETVLEEAVDATAKRARRVGLEDDLTAVVISYHGRRGSHPVES